MRKVLVLGALIVMAFGLTGMAKASSVTAGGVTYTFNPDGTDGFGGFLVEMSINAAGALSTATLNSFSLQFTNATNVALEISPGDWVNQGMGFVNTATGCASMASANWCFDGGSISVPSTSSSSDGTYDFVFDVSGLSTPPTQTHLRAFQPLGPTSPLVVDAVVGIVGGPPTTTPEPASVLLLGLGLAGSPFVRRRRS